MAWLRAVVRWVFVSITLAFWSFDSAASPTRQWHTGTTGPYIWFPTPEQATDYRCVTFFATHPTFEYHGEHRVTGVNSDTDLNGNGLCKIYFRYSGEYYQESLQYVYAEFLCYDQSTPVNGVCSEPPSKNIGPPRCPAGTGNPINTAYGGKYQHEIDVSSDSQTKLEFDRHYNSARNYASDIGYAWSHSFSRKLTPNYLRKL